MSDIHEEIVDKAKAEIAAAKVQEQTFAAKIKPHLVAIAFTFGGLLGFIAGHLHK